VKQGLLTLAGIALAVTAAMPAHALTNSIQTINQATYNLAQAYPCVVGTYPTSEGISDLRVWGGVCGTNVVTLGPGDGTFPGATPGDLCLARNGLALDVNCFAVAAGENATPPQFGPCTVQAYYLTKLVPGSFKCPDVYGLPHFFTNGDGEQQLAPYQYIQYGTGVRTWWALNFTQPGTRFILSVISVCRTKPTTDANLNTPGPAFVHKDVWEWRVVASPATMLQLINVMHGGAVSTLEVPCIIGEDMYDALIKAQKRLALAVAENPTASPALVSQKITDVGNAIFDMEALIVSNCLFVDVLDPLQAFPGGMQFGAPNIQPPGNLAQTVAIGTQGSAIAGIIDTIENPCCCKLLVDLEYIAIYNGVIGQVPHLPVVRPNGSYDPDDTVN
jgi:hypothetical protein